MVFSMLLGSGVEGDRSIEKNRLVPCHVNDPNDYDLNLAHATVLVPVPVPKHLMDLTAYHAPSSEFSMLI